MYQGSSSINGRAYPQERVRPLQQQPLRYADEEDAPSEYDDGSIDEGDFEMLPTRRAAGTGAGPSPLSASRSRRVPTVRKIRVKAHAADDVRYILIGTAIEFPDFVDRVRDKFGLAGRRFKIKMQDEDFPDGEKITMGDQDDLDMAVAAAQSAARKERLEAGKMNVSCSAGILE